jgi:hypothetical protein
MSPGEVLVSRQIAEYRTDRPPSAWISPQPQGNVDPAGNQAPARAAKSRTLTDLPEALRLESHGLHWCAVEILGRKNEREFKHMTLWGFCGEYLLAGLVDPCCAGVN